MKKKFEFESKTKTATIIDCMDCENYYTGACDGRAGGCSSYKPTRKITMEKDIRHIKIGVGILVGSLIAEYCGVLGYLLFTLF